MPEPNRDDLLGRVESLERANRRWKRLAAGLLAAVVLLLSVIGAFIAHQYTRLTAAKREAEQALQALRAAEAEREQAEEDVQRAKQAAEEALKRLEQ